MRKPITRSFIGNIITNCMVTEMAANHSLTAPQSYNIQQICHINIWLHKISNTAISIKKSKCILWQESSNVYTYIIYKKLQVIYLTLLSADIKLQQDRQWRSNSFQYLDI